MNRQVEWAKQIAAIAKIGLYYAGDPFDADRYQRLVDISAEMLADIAGGDATDFKRALTHDDGYITPKVDVRGAVFRDGQVLLVREAADGLWSLPGGWADVGDSPAQAIEREIREESGYEAKAIKLMALEDRKRRHPPSTFDVYKAFFLCELIGGAAKTSKESLDVDWFAPDDLPPLSIGRVTAEQIHRWFRHWRHPELPTEFD